MDGAMKCAVLVSKTTVLNTDASYIGDVQAEKSGIEVFIA